MTNHDSESQDVDAQNGLQHVASLIEENASVIAEFAADKERAVLLTAFCLRLGGFPTGALRAGASVKVKSGPATLWSGTVTEPRP